MPWTVNSSLNLSDKVILVTGCTSGIGLDAARFFLSRGAHLVMAARNAEKMANVARDFAEIGKGTITQLVIDTSDLLSVHAFVEQFKVQNIPKIDILLLNAGATFSEFSFSTQGYECTFATNHLGHWLLTGLLLPYLNAAPDARVIAVSSMVHKYTLTINYEMAAGRDKDSFDMMKAYAESKLANLMFVTHLNKILLENNSKVIAAGCHPGTANTPLVRSSISKIDSIGYKLKALVFSPFMQSSEMGSLPLIMASVDEHITRDCYYGPSGFLEIHGSPKRNCALNNALKDEAANEKLWTFSEHLTDYTYNF